jgi:hypothetical protein
MERLLNMPNANEFYQSSILSGDMTDAPHVAHRVFYKCRAARKEENG